MKTLFVVLLVFFQAVCATAQDWQVARVSGNVSYTVDGAAWEPVTNSIAIPNNAWVATGTGSRALLARGSERIFLRASTQVALQSWQGNGLQTRITQRQGSALFSIITRNQPHTSVDTPHLAAVVKGTVFEVTVTNDASGVRVDRGLVAVRDRKSRFEQDTTEGLEAVVSRIGSGVTLRFAQGSSLRDGNQLSLDPVGSYILPNNRSGNQPNRTGKNREAPRTDSRSQVTQDSSDSRATLPPARSNNRSNRTNETPRNNRDTNTGRDRGNGNGNGNGNNPEEDSAGNSNSSRGNGNGNRGVGVGNGGGNGTGNEGNGRGANNGKKN